MGAKTKTKADATDGCVVQEMRLADIRVDGGTQARVTISQRKVEEYAELYHDGVDLGPVVVFHDGSNNWLADGFTRREARMKEFQWIPAIVVPGSKRDAVLYAVGANATHGQPRTDEDKRNAVRMLLEDAEWGKWSDPEIAAQAKVSRGLVIKIRKAVGRDGERTVKGTRNGKPYLVKVTPKPPATTPPPAEPAKTYRCPEGCEETFDRQVWHCPDCGSHPLPEQQQCPDCGAACPMPAGWLDRGEEPADEHIPARASCSREQDAPKRPDGKADAQAVDAMLPHDELGRLIPEGLRDIFADQFLKDAVNDLFGIVQNLKSARWAKYLRLADAVTGLETARQAMLDAMPFCVHQECQGEGCDECRRSGYLTQWRFEELRLQER